MMVGLDLVPGEWDWLKDIFDKDKDDKDDKPRCPPQKIWNRHTKQCICPPIPGRSIGPCERENPQTCDIERIPGCTDPVSIPIWPLVLVGVGVAGFLVIDTLISRPRR